MKKFLLTMVAVLLFMGCTDKSNDEGKTANKENETKELVLKVGVDANYPPFEFIKNTKVSGFDIDLMEELSNRIGFKYKVINTPFDGLIPALKGGKIDAVISAMSATSDRRTSVDFTDSYFSTKNLYMRKKGNEEVVSKESLNGKRIGAQLGTLQESTAKTIQGAIVVPAEDIVSSVMALKAGKIDAVVVDLSIGRGYLKENDTIEEFLTEDDGSEGFSIAFDKNKHTDLIGKINEELKKIKSDGFHKSLLDKYELE